MSQEIKARARELGFDDCRITTAAPPASAEKFQAWLDRQSHGEMQWLQRNAFKRIDPLQVLQNAKSIVTLAVSYHNEAFKPAAAQIARYAHYADYHDLLAEPLRALTACIDQQPVPQLPILDFQLPITNSPQPPRSLWYVDTGPFLERDLAQRAGLGFVGKHTNLISRSLGNWFFIAEIITTAALEPDAPEKNRCGTCARCLAACPTQAITAPFQLDARRCVSYLTIELKGSIPVEFRKAIGNRIYGCDDCLAVCPWNRFAKEASFLKPHRDNSLATPDLLELLALDDAAFKKRFAASPILRTKRRGFLRNVCVALGNTSDRRALPALQSALQDAEPLIREHAQWAIEQICSRE